METEITEETIDRDLYRAEWQEEFVDRNEELGAFKLVIKGKLPIRFKKKKDAYEAFKNQERRCSLSYGIELLNFKEGA